MTEFKTVFMTEKRQYIIFLILSLTVLGFTIILYLLQSDVFSGFFGSINPILVIPLFIILGFGTLLYLQIKRDTVIFRKGKPKKWMIVSLIPLAFALGVILMEVFYPFSEDINVLFPKSLLFYPVMGFVAEIIFQLVPLSLLFALLTVIFKKVDQNKIIILCIMIVSLIEPIFQFLFDTSVSRPLWIKLIDAFRIYLFCCVQLFIYKRYDFVSMFLYRMVYYLFWHVIWGTIRLNILF